MTCGRRAGLPRPLLSSWLAATRGSAPALHSTRYHWPGTGVGAGEAAAGGAAASGAGGTSGAAATPDAGEPLKNPQRDGSADGRLTSTASAVAARAPELLRLPGAGVCVVGAPVEREQAHGPWGRRSLLPRQYRSELQTRAIAQRLERTAADRRVRARSRHPSGTGRGRSSHTPRPAIRSAGLRSESVAPAHESTPSQARRRNLAGTSGTICEGTGIGAVHSLTSKSPTASPSKGNAPTMQR